MDDIQRDYRERMAAILEMNAGRKAKIFMLQALMGEMREVADLSRNHDLFKGRTSCEVLSTSIS